jgi:glycosyltransferase involved in cell wall biosynthesis
MPDLFAHGGTPRKLAAVTRALCERGVCQTFLVFGGADDGLVRQIGSSGGRVVPVKRRASFDPRLALAIAAAVRRLRADVVVTHFARADIHGAVGARLAGRPVIKAVEGIRWSDRRGIIACDRMLGRLRCLVLANSRATLQAARGRGGVRSAVVVYPGVADPGPRNLRLGREVRRELGIADSPLVVGHIGGLIRLRRQETLIEATAVAARELPRLHLVLVGDGPLRSVLARQAHALGVDGNVTILGYRTDVERLRHAFDCYVNPAEAEGFGIATVEAMFTGAAVIVADTGASPELVDDGQTGIVVPVGDPVALARAILQLVERPDWASTLGQAARAVALERFTMDRYADDLERVYRQVAGSTSRTRGRS